MILRQVGFCGGLVRAKQINCGRPIARIPFGNREAILRGANRGSQVFRKFLAPELVGKLLPAVYNSRNGDGVDAALRHITQTLLLQEFDG